MESQPTDIELEAAAARVAYIKGAKAVFSNILEETIERSPWLLASCDTKIARLCIDEAIDEMFHDASSNDRDLVQDWANELNKIPDQRALIARYFPNSLEA